MAMEMETTRQQEDAEHDELEDSPWGHIGTTGGFSWAFVTAEKTIAQIWRQNHRDIDYIGGFRDNKPPYLTRGWILTRTVHRIEDIRNMTVCQYVHLCYPTWETLTLHRTGLLQSGHHSEATTLDEHGNKDQPFKEKFLDPRYDTMWRPLVTKHYSKWTSLLSKKFLEDE